MKRQILWIALAALVASSALAQPAPPQPAAGRGRGFGVPAVRSPEVSADGRVTFRLRAPNASSVMVRGITPQPIPMQKDEQGVWSATTEPLKPDLYEYNFVVDGLSILDPANPRFRPAYRIVRGSAVLVPGDIPWTPLPNAPRGAVSQHFFQSKVAGDERDFFVYTPPNYDPKRKQPYPVLYLLHGLGDDARAWIEIGAANVTLDTLINQGKAAPMIMVNPLGYGTAAGPADIDREDMLPSYIRILLEEVMPQVEKLYNVSTRRADRAIAGLSMGGAQAALVGLNNLDKFAWIGSYSGAFNLWPLTRPPRETATPGMGAAAAGRGAGAAAPGRGPGVGPQLIESRLPATFPGLSAKSNAQIQLLWIACGTADSLIGVNRQFKAYLDSIGVKVNYKEIPDVGHVWPLWRQNLAEFAPLLFK